MRVVALDDELDVAGLIIETAESMGWSGLATTNPHLFIDCVKAGVDLVFIDLIMPIVDGIEVLNLLDQAGSRANIVLMSGLDDKTLAVAERLTTRLGLNSLGHLTKPFRIEDVEELLEKAASTESAARNRAEPIGPLQVGEIVEAIENDRVVPYFQLKTELSSRRTIGCETLMRLVAKDGSIVSPARFIDVSERSGLIGGLTGMLMESAFCAFSARAPEGWSLSVNISPTMLGDAGLPDRLAGIAEKYGVRNDKVILEITETAVVGERSELLGSLSRLRIKGFRISIDDYGTGFSTMSQLRNMPATELKIDQQFISHIERDRENQSLVRNTVSLCHDLGLTVVAEGIESEAQEAFLAGIGCDQGQGYLYNMPMALDELLSRGDRAFR